MTTLRQLSYLVALADEQHFRRAAERVHVTQPTLSAQLQTLEGRLDVSLIERSTSQVTLTP
ncbi:MAG: LysR family transcriptional regulator, partial [Proteobacteria bacterium]|nr:LysR family transcriptional regulator [Pseudomonadota bacterium]